jgi:hypothetical protein
MELAFTTTAGRLVLAPPEAPLPVRSGVSPFIGPDRIARRLPVG